MKGDKVKRIMILLMAVILTLSGLLSGLNVLAAEPGESRVYLRAKLEYQAEGGLKGLTDETLTFSSDKWKKDGDFYYYEDPVKSGETVELIKAVRVPSDWNNDTSGKKFSLIVTIEASECLTTDSGWKQNFAPSYAQTFDFAKKTAEVQGMTVKQGNISITLQEYQKNQDGSESEYKNNKIVVPGETVSKIVRVTVNGTPSVTSLTQKIAEALKVPQLVQTGDSRAPELAGYVIAALAAALGVCGIGIARRKERYGKKG